MSTLRADHVLGIKIGQASDKLIGRTRFTFNDQGIEIDVTRLALDAVDLSLGQEFPAVLHRNAASRAYKFGEFGVGHN